MLKFNERPSPNHDARPAGANVDVLVMHYTGMRTAEDALRLLCDPGAGVSSHYTVDEDGTIYRHVAEERRARHAGQSWWAGHRDINSRSIGIEIVNPGHELGYRPFPKMQIGAVIALAKDIVSRHAIPPRNVVGHSDVAPERKQDPGELFPWRQLAEAGVGLWPDGAPKPLTIAFEEALRRYGYGFQPDTEATLEQATIAFQRHFRPSRIDGEADGECESLLSGLLAKTG
ncbi:MAG: N-acetylmuramoyl-L-alanine amidase [Alphaproteobacteria bacterium]